MNEREKAKRYKLYRRLLRKGVCPMLVFHWMAIAGIIDAVNEAAAKVGGEHG